MGVPAYGRIGVCGAGRPDVTYGTEGIHVMHISRMGHISPIRTQREYAASHISVWLHQYVFTPIRPYADTLVAMALRPPYPHRL